jgi:hypothetical protein
MTGVGAVREALSLTVVGTDSRHAVQEGTTMKRAVALFALLLTVALAGCTGSSGDTEPVDEVLYVCSVMPDDDRESIPLLAEGKAGAREVGQLPVDGMELGCELDRQQPGAVGYLHIVAPRSYIRSKTGADSGWGSLNDVVVLANPDMRGLKVYTGDR